MPGLESFAWHRTRGIVRASPGSFAATRENIQVPDGPVRSGWAGSMLRPRSGLNLNSGFHFSKEKYLSS